MSDEENKKFLIKPIYWTYYDDEDEKTTDIYIGGLTQNQETIQVKVAGYSPSAYLELPEGYGWNRSLCKRLFGVLQDTFTNFQREEWHCPPVAFGMYTRWRLHYRKKIMTMNLEFDTQAQLRSFASKLSSRKIYVPGIGSLPAGALKIHEASIDPVIKFTAINKLSLANWLEIEGEEEDFSDSVYSIVTEASKIKEADPKLTKEIIVEPKYASFDLEVTSKNHNSKLPNADEPHNKIFQAAITFGRIGHEGEKAYLLSLFDPHDIPTVHGIETEVIRCKDEDDLMFKFRDLIVKNDPDIFIGYNILKFDWNYMIQRCKDTWGIFSQFCRMSRLKGKKAEEKVNKWKSAAYGTQEFSYLEVPGRMNLDVLCEVERNFKLPKYSLDFVAETYLGEHKEDVTPRQLFMLYDLTAELLPQLKERKLKIVELTRLKKRIPHLLPRRKCHGKVATLRKKLIESKTQEEFLYHVRDALTITGFYNVVDTILPIRLVNKMNILEGMNALSNVCNVPLSYLHTRGQQIKVLSQVLREAIEEQLVIPSDNPTPKDPYEGAKVVEAKPGYYYKVPSLDFNSLYPSVMIASNVCYTTILEDDDPTPDEECHVIPIQSHVGCPHDKLKRKRKKDKIICCDVTYRFRKVRIELKDDGTVVYHNEGVLPRMLRKLLNKRKDVKKEMAKAQAKLDMHLGEAKPEDIENWRKWGYEIIEKGSLTEKQEAILRVIIVVLNALQLALKVSANSAYGTLGATEGMIPLKPGAATVTALGRKFILEAIRYLKEIIPSTKIIYGDTDSCMPEFVGATLKETFELARYACKRISHHLKCIMMQVEDNFQVVEEADKSASYEIGSISSQSPKFKLLTRESKIRTLEYEMYPINLDLENVYGKFFLLSKKRYLTIIMDEDGNHKGLVKKGVVMARRDNFQFMRDTYKALAFDGILADRPEVEVMRDLYDNILKMFTRQVPDTHYLIYMGLREVVTYAKKKEIENKEGKVICTRYISKNGTIINEDVKNPLDERLDYPNLPQVLLALKMMRRGDDVPPNTRLEFLYLKNPDAEHLGDSAEDYTYYKENKRVYNFQIDPFIYLNKLTTPIDEVIYVRYPRPKVHYRKLDDRMKLAIQSVSGLCYGPVLFQRIKRVREYVYEAKMSYNEEYNPNKVGDNYIGWILRKKKRPYNIKKPHVYRAKGLRGKCRMIVKSSECEGMNQFNEPEHHDIVQTAKEWLARDVLNRLYAQYGLRKRPAKKATRSGEKLTLNCSVITIKDFDSFEPIVEDPAGSSESSKPPKSVFFKEGTEGKIINVIEEKTQNPKKPNYYYDIVVDEENEVVMYRVPRSYLITYYLKDGTVMQDIYRNHSFYSKVVSHFNSLDDTKETCRYLNTYFSVKSKVKKTKSS